MSIKLIIFTVLISLMGCTSSDNRVDYAEHTVSVTNSSKTSGGSGTIIFSNENSSDILTNNHVCDLLRSGGWVNRENGLSYPVHSFRRSTGHDLCLVRVATNLHVETKLAQRPPKFLETSVVAGHPHLLPLIVNSGHFSKRETIQVMTGTRECTEKEKQDERTSMFCAFVGRLPVIRIYDSQIVSNLIQPGSSGSGVYNSDNELSDVIFAGNGPIGYGFSVPFEYVYLFLNKELPVAETVYPDTTLKFVDEQESLREYHMKAWKFCNEHNIQDICATFQDTKRNDRCVK